MSMNLRSIRKHMLADIMAGNAVCIKGQPGLGKTDMTMQVAAWWAAQQKDKSVGVNVTFLALQSQVGGTGLPFPGKMTVNGREYTITDPAVPEWFLAADMKTGEVRPSDQFHYVFQVFDEWGQGPLEAKRQFCEVLLHGRCGKWQLPAGSPRVALTNVDARDGVTKLLDMEIGRRAEKTVAGDVTVWLEDFADRPYPFSGRSWQVQPIVKAWAQRHPEIMFEAKPEKQGPWCNPRSLTMADRYMQSIAELNGGTMPIEDSGFINSLAGYIGMAATTSLVGDLHFLIELPSYADVVKAPMETPLPEKADLMLLMAYQLAGMVQPDDIGPVLQYVDRIAKKSADMSITFVASLLRRDYAGIVNLAPMQAWISKNAARLSIITALAG